MPENEENAAGPEVVAGDATSAQAAPMAPATGEDTAPVVLVPVSAEDFRRRKRRIIWTCTIAAVLAIAATAYIYKVKTDPIRVHESLEAANRLYRLGRFEQAILELNYAVSIDPTVSQAYLVMGRSRMSLSRAQESVPDFTKFIELRPNDPIGYIERAQAYMEMEKFEPVVEDCTRALAINPNLGVAYNLRGVAYRALEDITNALADMNRAIGLEPTMNHYFERAATLQIVEQHERALEDLNKVVEFAPLNAQAYHARARSYRALGDIESADRDHAYGRALDSR